MPLRSCLRYALACLVASLPSRFGVYLLVAGPSHVFASPCLCLAMPCHAVPSPLRAVPFLCRAVPRLCTTVPCFANASHVFAVPLRCVATPSLIRSCLRSSDSDQIQAVPLLCQLMLRYACAYSAFPMRGVAMPINANQCRCNSPRYISSLFLCRSILCVAYAAHRVSSPSLIGAYPRPIKSYRLPGLSILRFASASQSATIHFRSGA